MSAKSMLNQFKAMADSVIAQGKPALQEYYEAGDWLLLVVNRGYLEELELTPEQQQTLDSLDMQLSRIFTDELLTKYSLMDEGVRSWWG